MWTVSRVEGPAIVDRDERPALDRQSERQRVAFDVGDSSSDLVGMFEENLPTAAVRPGRMDRCPVLRRAQANPAGLLESFHHLFRLVPVLADQDVDMVRHDRTGVTGIAV